MEDNCEPNVKPIGEASVNPASALIAISLILLLALGAAALFMAGTRSRDANDADPPDGP
mgnify:CR=1 FL=1